MKITPIRFALIVLIAGFLAISSCTTLRSEPSSPITRPETLRPLLNSERIRQRFGSYGIDVVRDSDELRVSNLFSLEGGTKIMRTFAVVIYPETIPAPIVAEHSEIKSGQSIGEIFSSNGWIIDKQNIYFGEMQASPEFAAVYSAMGGIHEVNLAMHVYQLVVGKNGNWFPYSRIAEVHHPDYLDSKELSEIYGVASVEPGLNDESVQNTLDVVVRAMKSFNPDKGVNQPASRGLKSASRPR